MVGTPGWRRTAVQAALEVAWAAANLVGGKRLVYFILALVPILQRHHHLTFFQPRLTLKEKRRDDVRFDVLRD